MIMILIIIYIITIILIISQYIKYLIKRKDILEGNIFNNIFTRKDIWILLPLINSVILIIMLINDLKKGEK